MLPGPVFNVELLTLARKGRYYLLRSLYGGMLLLLLWTNNPYTSGKVRVLSIQQAARLGESLFMTFAITQYVAVVVLTPVLVAGTIADERQRKTLHYLLASRLSSAEIVLGKLFARGLHLAVFIAAGLPILALISLFGGADPEMILLTFVASFSTAFFLGGMAILASTYARRPRDAVSLSCIGTLVWLLGPSMLMALTPTAPGWYARVYETLSPVVSFVGACSPVFLTTSLSFRGGPTSAFTSVAWMIGLQLAFGALFASAAVVGLRPSFRAEGGKSRVWRGFGRWVGPRFLRRPECGDDAMLWKERHVSRTTPLMKVVSGLFLLGLVGLLLYGCTYFVPDAYRELMVEGYTSNGYRSRLELNGFLRATMTLLATCAVFGTASAAAGSLTSEREQDTWVSLIASPLTAGEIVRAKAIGAAWGLRSLIGLWAVLLALGVFLGAVHPLGVLTSSIVLATYVTFAAWLGVFFSLHCRSSSRAMLATVGTLLVTNVLYLIPIALVSQGGTDSMILMAGVTPMVEAVSVVSYQELDGLLGVSRGHSFGSYWDMAFTCLSSTLLYGVAGVVLGGISVSRFDEINDRPKDEGPEPPRTVVEKNDPTDAEPESAAAEAAAVRDGGSIDGD